MKEPLGNHGFLDRERGEPRASSRHARETVREQPLAAPLHPLALTLQVLDAGVTWDRARHLAAYLRRARRFEREPGTRGARHLDRDLPLRSRLGDARPRNLRAEADAPFGAGRGAAARRLVARLR